MQAVAEISMMAVRENYLSIRRVLPPRCHLICVLKANAYGHGALPLGRLYSSFGEVSFAVAHLQEGIALREGGITAPILLLGHLTDTEVQEALAYHLTPSIHSLTQAKELSRGVGALGLSLTVHLKLDSGMGRLGFRCDSAKEVEEAMEVLSLPYLKVTGVYTHFARADVGDAGQAFTALQYNRFTTVANVLDRVAHHHLFRHTGNSGALLDYPSFCEEGVRVGILLYGVHPSKEVRHTLPLTPVMTLKTPIIHIKEVPAGTPIGYGGAYITSRPCRIATLPIGYGDGIHRLWGDLGLTVTLKGIPCPLVGRVCMDSCTIDVSGVPNVHLGDEVVFFGRGSIHVATVAEGCQTIPYEILSGIGGRVARVYV